MRGHCQRKVNRVFYKVLRRLTAPRSMTRSSFLRQCASLSFSVELLRQTQMRRFLNECRDALDKAAPESRTNFNGEEIRGKFLSKLSDGERLGSNLLLVVLCRSKTRRYNSRSCTVRTMNMEGGGTRHVPM